MIGLTRVNKALLLLSVVLLVTCVQYYPLVQYSTAPASFVGQTQQEQTNYLQTGHMSESRRGEVILDNLGVITSLIVTAQSRTSLPIPLSMAALFVSLAWGAVVLLFAENPARQTRLIFGVAVSVIAFALAATPDIITQLSGWNGPYAWLFVFAALYVILFKKPTRSMIALSLVFLSAIVLTYFTIAVFMVVLFGVATFYALYSKRPIVSMNTALVYVVFVFAWLMYMSIFGFNSIVSIIPTFSNLFGQETRALGLAYIGGGSGQSFFWNALANVLASIPLLYFVFHGRKLIDHKAREIPVIGFLTLFVLTLCYYAWMGVTGVVQRIPSYMALFAIVSLALLSTSKIKRSHLAVLAVVALMTVGISSFTYLNSEYNGTKLTFSEAGGTVWLMQHSSPKNYTFTDLRLAAPFIGNKYQTIGINDVALSSAQVNSLLEKLFYAKGSPFAGLQELEKFSNAQATYLFLSNRYTQPTPGFQGYDFVYKPVPSDYLTQYESLPQFNVIYRNTDITILQVSSTTRQSS
jgi:hypothetical protein